MEAMSIPERQAAMRDNFHTNVVPYLDQREGEAGPWAHQPRLFRELDDGLHAAEPGTFRTLLAHAPGIGKTTIGAITANLMGVGQPPGEGEPPLRGLSFTPYYRAIYETLEEYDRHAPDILAMPFRNIHDLGRVVTTDRMTVMTYYAAQSMEDSDFRRLVAGVDFVVLDEVHRALGPQTSSRMRELFDVCQPTALMMSGSPRFNDLHSVREVLGVDHTPQPISARDAIDMGIASGVKLHALHSGERPDPNNPRRNGLYVDIACDMNRLGRSGLIHCKAGGGSKQARDIAKATRRRGVNAEAVGDFQTHKENMGAVKRFENGETDVLSFTQLLKETYHPRKRRIGYILTAGSGSMVDMIQLTGRGAQPNEEGWLTYYFAIIDRYDIEQERGRAPAPKRLYLPHDVFGVDRFVPEGTTLVAPLPKQPSPYGRQTAFSPRQRTTPKTAEPEDIYSESVLQAMSGILPNTPVEELTVVRRTYEEPPDGYVPLRALPVVLDGLLSPSGAQQILAMSTTKDGQPLLINVQAKNGSLYVLQEAEELLRERCLNPAEWVSRREIVDFLVANGLPAPSVEAFDTACRDAGVEMRISKGTASMTPHDAETLLRFLDAVPLVNPDEEIPFVDLAHGLGRTSASFLIKIADRIYPGQILERRNGKPPQSYRIVRVARHSEALDVLQTAANSPRNRKLFLKQLGDRSPTEFLGEMIVGRQEAMRGLRTKIGEAAIASFVAQFAEAASLDDSYILSGYGDDWIDHMLCFTNLYERYFPPGGPTTQREGQIREAKAVCKKCPVKGDCLRSILLHPDSDMASDMAGGFTPIERQELDTVQLLEWFDNPPGQTDPNQSAPATPGEVAPGEAEAMTGPPTTVSPPAPPPDNAPSVPPPKPRIGDRLAGNARTKPVETPDRPDRGPEIPGWGITILVEGEHSGLWRNGVQIELPDHGLEIIAGIYKAAGPWPINDALDTLGITKYAVLRELIYQINSKLRKPTQGRIVIDMEAGVPHTLRLDTEASSTGYKTPRPKLSPKEIREERLRRERAAQPRSPNDPTPR